MNEDTLTFNRIISKKINTTDFVIVNCEKKSLEDVITGYLGDYSSLKITIKRGEDEGSHFFFSKSLPKTPSQRKLALEMNAYFKESRFYDRYYTELKKLSIDVLDDVLPVCFFTSEESLIFEDLTVRGYQTLLSRVPLDLIYTKSALTTLSKLHASGLLFEEMTSSQLIDFFKEELGRTNFSNQESVKKAIEATKRGIEAIIDFSHPEDIFFKTKALEGVDSRNEYTKPSTNFRNTLCHGDPWNNNFMFKKNEDDSVSSVIIDFQSYRYGPPAQDVMTFLHFTTSRQLRNDHLEDLLLFYYEKSNKILSDFGLKNLVTKSEFFKSCEYFKRFALTQTVTRFQFIGLSKEVLSEREKSDKYEFTMSLCQKDEIYRKMNFEAMTELRDFYLET